MAVNRHYRAKWFDEPIPRGWKPREYSLVVVRLSPEKFGQGIVRSGLEHDDGRYLVRVHVSSENPDGRISIERTEQLIHLDDMRPLRRPVKIRPNVHSEGEPT